MFAPSIVVENIAVMITLKLVVNWLVHFYPWISYWYAVAFTVGAWMFYMYHCQYDWGLDGGGE